MAVTSDTYLTEIPYTPRFHRELAPSWLVATLRAIGIAAPSIEGGRYCEIGCGPGFGLTLLAVGNPSMQFVGFDINPAHIAEARRLAEGVPNVSFHVADVTAMPDASGPFDFVVAHGIHSWVSERVRRGILDLAGRALAPGGVCYLHYMTHPGSAPFAAFHALLRQRAARSGNALQAVETGLATLQALKDAGAGFFAAHPAAGSTLEHLAREDHAYVAHEYLNPDFTPLHVADVMAEAARVGLSHAGSATPIENIDALSIPGSVLPLVQGEKDAALRETLKDMARNQAMRRDLYVKAPRQLDRDAHMAALRAQVFSALPGAPTAGPLVFDTRIGPVEGPAAAVTPVLARLAEGPASFGELERLPAFQGKPGLLNQILHVMMGAGVLHPLLPDQRANPGAERLNAALIEAMRQGRPVSALVSPETGSAVIF